MIFGKTSAQKSADLATFASQGRDGVRRFAFLPKELNDGRFIWLEHYWKYWYVSGTIDVRVTYYCYKNQNQEKP